VKFRIIVCTALVAVITVVPTASARPAHVTRTHHAQVAEGGIATGVATSIAAEIAKEGIKAGVAKWAPEYYKYVDPTGAALAAIQEQLAQLDAKLTELANHQRALGERLSCEIQRTALGTTLSEIKGWYFTLREQQYVRNLSSQQTNLESLFTERHRMHAAQIHLHDALVGNNLPNLIRSCAKHIEETEYPFLSAYVHQEVWNFWSLYRAASTELLVVRVNMVAIHPELFPESKGQDMGKSVQSDWAAEEREIKPAFPDHLSYDKQSQHLWLSFGVPHGWYLRETYQQSGWHFTGYATTPTCSAVLALFHKTGATGWPAIELMRHRHIIKLHPGTDTILCFDDHDRLHEFDLATGTYRYAGEVQSYAQSVATRANVINGHTAVHIASYSYTG
jgi:hypothetical protein